MDRVAQGGTYDDTFGPIIDASGNPVTNGVSAGHLTVEQFVDSANTDKSSGVTIAHVGLGIYRITRAIPSDGVLRSWSFTLKWDNTVEAVRRFHGSFEVITVEKDDPASVLDATALEAAAANIQTSLDNLGTFIAETADLATLDASLAALSAAAAETQASLATIATELGDVATLNSLQAAVDAFNSRIGTLSVAQLPIATGTGGAAVWVKEVV